jgi:glycine betaine/proline transport system permease protein/glycine betaine/proline transport system substrate-binding protein
MKKIALLLMTALLLTITTSPALPASAEQTAITFADVGWDSIRFHNAVAGVIAENAFGYTWEEISGSTPITSEGLMAGDIDVHMEMWTDNLATYDEDIAQGRMKELSVNFDDNAQGLYVPRYVIEGDSARGIEPVAPDLRTVEDLAKYADIFKDPEDPGKGRIFGGLPGWEVTTVMEKKVQFYGLDQMYNYVMPGSDAAMSAAFVSAWDKGDPIVAYYWEPTWLMGMYDFVLLTDAPYDPATYLEGKTACPSTKVTICVSNDFASSNPAFCEFLSKYQTSSALINEALAHMQTTGDDYAATAKWFLSQHAELVDQWLTAQQATALRAAL